MLAARAVRAARLRAAGAVRGAGRGAARAVTPMPAALRRCGVPAARRASGAPLRALSSKKKKHKAAAAAEAEKEEEEEDDDVLFDPDVYELRMEAHLEHLRASYAMIRAGRASPEQLDGVEVDAYGSMQPLRSVAHVSARGPQTLVVSVHDPSLAAAVEEAIRGSELDLQPVADGKVITVPFPKPSKEARENLARVAAAKAEDARVAVRRTRRKGADLLKRLESEENVSSDETHRYLDELQRLTERFNKEVDEALTAKQKDINTV